MSQNPISVGFYDTHWDTEDLFIKPMGPREEVVLGTK